MATSTHRTHNPSRIAISGGPGAGKSTAADLFRRELGERVVIVPESATMLFSGGYPRYEEPDAVRATQRAIFHVQRGIEYAQASRYPGRVLLCDRGTVDGAAHWPDGEDAFFTAMGTTLEDELKRYDAVLFFESAAVGGLGIEGGNPARIETIAQAADLDERLRRLWAQHERFVHVPHRESFVSKIVDGLAALQEILDGSFD